LRSVLSKDLVAGIVFVVFGLGALWIARRYTFGTTSDMGPGYVPILASSALVILGTLIGVGAVLRRSGKPVGHLGLRGLLAVATALLLFGLLLERLGLAVGVMVLVGVAVAGQRWNELRIGETALLVLFLVAMSAGIFVWGLGLPLRLLP
jgi:hypothetical protein